MPYHTRRVILSDVADCELANQLTVADILGDCVMVCDRPMEIMSPKGRAPWAHDCSVLDVSVT